MVDGHIVTKIFYIQEEALNSQLAEVNKKIDAAEESRLLKQVTQEIYAKFITRYQAEREKMDQVKKLGTQA